MRGLTESEPYPHKKINQCLTDINQCLTSPNKLPFFNIGKYRLGSLCIG